MWCDVILMDFDGFAVFWRRRNCNSAGVATDVILGGSRVADALAAGATLRQRSKKL